jgi:5-methyltetrahydrofolate corrinoid/iron sulfur protein methyltransferase
MLIIGELINGMYKRIARAIAEKDKATIQECALEQVKAGAEALDVNCGPGSADPVSDMRWLVETIQEATDKTLSLDSSRPQAIKAGLEIARNKVIINSTTADPDKLEILVPLAKKHNAKLIGLAISSKGIPHNKDQRLESAAGIVAYCVEQGFNIEDLYLDPILMPLNVAQAQLKDILESIHEFKLISQPSPKTVVGLSNISQGTRSRSLINRSFIVMAMAEGLDCVILNPLDKKLMDAVIASEVILNKKIYCDSFLDAYGKR